MRKIETSVSQILLKIAIPVLFVCGIMYSFSGLAKHQFEITHSIIIFIITFLVGVTTLIATAYLLNKLSRPFKGVAEYTKTLLVTTIAFSVFFVIWCIPALAPTLTIPFRILSLYSLVIFYRGAEVILEIRFEKLIGFTMLTAIMFALVITIMGIIFSTIFQHPISL